MHRHYPKDQVHPVEPGKRKLRKCRGRCYRVTVQALRVFGVYVHRRQRRRLCLFRDRGHGSLDPGPAYCRDPAISRTEVRQERGGNQAGARRE